VFRSSATARLSFFKLSVADGSVISSAVHTIEIVMNGGNTIVYANASNSAESLMSREKDYGKEHRF
jgi:hypothetical protein